MQKYHDIAATIAAVLSADEKCAVSSSPYAALGAVQKHAPDIKMAFEQDFAVLALQQACK